MSHRDMAVARLRAGLCVLPARTDSKRPALTGWKEFQNRLPTENEVRAWFADEAAMCIVAGAVSGNLEMLDFDAGGTAFDAWADLVRSESPDLFDRLVIERSPSGGRHVVYRCPDGVSANLKLAQRKVVVPSGEPVELHGKEYIPRRVGDQFEVLLTLIETRGEGGLFLCHPTAGYELLQGDLADVPMIEATERELLLHTAWSLDELPPVALPDLPPGDPCGRPGDDFNDRGDVRELLERHGGYIDSAEPEDYELWLRWLDAGVRFAKVPRELLTWHDPPARLSRTHPRYAVEAFYACKCRYLARAMPRDRPVWLWGAGRITRQRFAAFERAGGHFAGFIDIDPKKTGRAIGGRPVVAPDAIPADAFVIVGVGTRGARELIRAALVAQGRGEGVDFLVAA